MNKPYTVQFQDGSEREIISTEDNIREWYPTIINIQERKYKLMDKERLFENTKKLIYSRAWHYSRKYNMDFEDLKSEGFRIFCEAVERFDDRAKFTTFLFHRLRTLNDYCRREKHFVYEDIDGIEYTEDPITEQTERILFKEAVDNLSSDGKTVVQGILEGEFHNPYQQRLRTIGKYRVKEVMGWDEMRVNRVWKELRDWWGNSSPEITI